MRNRSSNLFSLIELLVALAILGLGLAFLVQALGHAGAMRRVGRSLTIVPSLAQEKVEEALLACAEGGALPKAVQGRGSGPATGLTWRRTLTPRAVSGGAVVDIQVTVHWREGKRERTYVLQTSSRPSWTGGGL
ncbi:MAG: prepilin-type N-terminal cleavage/methylation domain-containing protein [Lentisphaerae bacterium]|nr:prepilin-type N-terminal cleavage/methylation domain-containing protein [Lentisphaerota bacterium]MBT4820424.1 prepilin-type N-terminal cleavage/methylation domain-containing protein [Lentisphaerota bacterium]MBT5613122.1 prepilin-type N-terminal cleavage/methylation domain-containing protein [Lentisphaerota bacterium]MBT7061985.1 prepilin-type N-terminal cleavage/methylation domain-containing protein [Lentisphaerota bacterium]MBT7844435.1 prepilin-type N-terminal cleavage/methylation domain